MTGRRLVVVAAVVVLAAVAFGSLFAARRAGTPDSYDAGAEATFMDACVTEAGLAMRPTCRCIWDGLVASVPFERYAAVDDELAPQVADHPAGTPLELPDDVGGIVRSCVEAAAPG
ncbi:MAG: hypothetical protein R2690_03770 [Acidimicrobiales bacterium]